MAVVEVTRLVEPKARVEIEATAVLPEMSGTDERRTRAQRPWRDMTEDYCRQRLGVGCGLDLIAPSWTPYCVRKLWTLLAYYLVFIIAGDVLAYFLGLFVEYEWGPHVSLIVFLRTLFRLPLGGLAARGAAVETAGRRTAAGLTRRIAGGAPATVRSRYCRSSAASRGAAIPFCLPPNPVTAPRYSSTASGSISL